MTIAIIRKNVPGVYDADDVIAVVDDGFTLNAHESINFDAVNVGVIDDADKNLLLLEDDVFTNISAISKLQAFKSVLFKSGSMIVKRRRKYRLNNALPELKY